MIIGTVRIVAARDPSLEALDVLKSIQGPVLAEPGCVAFDIYEEQSADRAIVLVERWETRAALETHLRSDAYRRVLAAIELSGAQPGVRFDYVSSSEGFELVERSRGTSPTLNPDGNPSQKTDSDNA